MTGEIVIPQYFNDPISRVSCPKWDVEDPAVFLKMANFSPWKEDWDELLNELGIDSIKMHGRESVTRLYETMDIIRKYEANEEFLFTGFEEYLKETNLIEKPINIWREKIKNCKFDCWECQYCDKIYDKKTDIQYSDLVKHVAEAIAVSGVPTVRINIPGLTSARVQTLLNTLAQGVDTYLEVGAAMGATFCATIKDNPLIAVAIDNWKDQIQPATDNIDALPANSVHTFIENVKAFKGHSTITVVDSDLFSVDTSRWFNKIKMWFYDGPHDFESTKRAVQHYYNTLADEAIIVFDDANWQGVVDGARAGLESVGAKITYEKMMLTEVEDPNSWWNGLYIVVISKRIA